MARKRSHHHQRSRQQPGSERSYYEYLVSSPAHVVTRPELLRMIRGGEDTYLELKVRFSNVEKLIAEIIALANTDGGAIIFGVNDQLRIEGVDDPESVEEQLREICARQIQPPVMPWINKVAFDNGRRIVTLELTPADRPHRTMDDRFYLREGAIKREATREELSRIYRETHLTRFEQVPVFGATIEQEIDESLFWSYIRGVDPGPWGEGKRGFPTTRVMREMGLALKVDEELWPTMGGMLLFGKDASIRELLPFASLVVTRYSGEGVETPVIEQVRLHGNLLSLFDGALRMMERYIDLWDARPSRKMREEAIESIDEFLPVRANYSRPVVVEALINSLAHRDWGARDREARINIFDGAVEIINPALVPELPIVSVRYGLACSPNPRLKAILTNEHYGLAAVHGGVPGLVARQTEFSRRAPDGLQINNGEFRVRLHGLV